MVSRVLHLLSQRPLLTGSGITLDALVHCARINGWDQHVAIGVPYNDTPQSVGGLSPDRIFPLAFGRGDLDFPVPGMSDVMPYTSTRFSRMAKEQLVKYRQAWRRHIKAAITEAKPDVIHSHHIWIMSSLVKSIAPHIPVVNHCHATGFRQMVISPHLAHEVKSGCAKNDRFCVLHQEHADHLTKTLHIPAELIHLVGAGYRHQLFHADRQVSFTKNKLLYVGKYSPAKGLPWLLDAVARLKKTIPAIELHVAGTGAGKEALELESRMLAMAPTVKLHGQLDQPALADLMRSSSVCVLPSFYEGVPLVLVEALACGCRLVSTRLGGVVSQLAPHMDDALEMVPLPGLIDADVPSPKDLPTFVDNLCFAIESALEKPPLDTKSARFSKALKPFTWDAVFGRVEDIWRDLIRTD